MTKRWKDTIVLPVDSPPNETSNGEASNALWKLAQGAHSSWSGNGLFRVRIQIGLVRGITKLWSTQTRSVYQILCILLRLIGSDSELLEALSQFKLTSADIEIRQSRALAEMNSITAAAYTGCAVAGGTPDLGMLESVYQLFFSSLWKSGHELIEVFDRIEYCARGCELDGQSE